MVWVWSTLFTLRQQSQRRKNIAPASEQLTALGQRLLSARVRLRGAAEQRAPVRPSTRPFPRGLQHAYISTETGEDLTKKVAEKVGVKVQYLALFRSGAELVQDHGPNSALTHMDRLPEYRIDAGANAVKTLRKHGVTAGGSLKLLLRPLHADHIHYAFSIYY